MRLVYLILLCLLIPVVAIAGIKTDNIDLNGGYVSNISFTNGGILKITTTGANFWDLPVPMLTPTDQPILLTGLLWANRLTNYTAISYDNLTAIIVSFSGLDTMPNLTSISAPSLQYVGGSFSPSTMASLTNMYFPSLQYVGGTFTPSTMASLTNMYFPSLQYVGGSFSPNNMPMLQSIEATNIVSINVSTTINAGFGNLVNVNIGAVGKTINLGSSINISGQKLTVFSISNNLAVLNSLDGTSGKQYWGTSFVYTCNGGTSAGLSTWGASMYTWKTNIQNRGGTVTANP